MKAHPLHSPGFPIRRLRTIAIVGSFAAALMVTACTSDDGGNADGDPPSSDEPEVTLSFLDVPDPAGNRELVQEQIAIFEDQNPRINVEVELLPAAEYHTALDLMYSQGNSPDVFRFLTGAQFRPAVEEGWLEPLNEFMTDDFKAQFPDEVFDTALSSGVIDDTVYSIPLIHDAWRGDGSQKLFYNPDILAEYGATGAPETWSEFEDLATTITENGDGQVFGFAPQGSNPRQQLAPLYAVNGGALLDVRGIDYRTGQTAFSDESIVGAVELLAGLAANDVFTPGWETWNAEEVHAQFARGRLAMAIGGWWWSHEIPALNPDIPLEVAPVPVPDGGALGSIPSSRPGLHWSMSSRSEHPEEAWKLIEFLSSPDYHQAYTDAFNTPTYLAENYEDGSFAELAIEMAEENSRVAPVSEDGGTDVYNLIVGVSREFGFPAERNAAAEAALLGTEDFRTLAEDIDARLDKAIDDAIAKAQADGVDISREDLAFASNWDPMQDFQPAS